MSELEAKCIELMQQVLKISSLQCRSENYESSSVWDSLKHMELIVAIEKAFSIQFNEDEMIALTSLENIKRILLNKI